MDFRERHWPCTIRHTALGDGVPNPEYFPENSFRVIGDTAITDIIQQYDRQLIFAQDRAFYSYCDLTTDAMGNAYASIAPYDSYEASDSTPPRAV